MTGLADSLFPGGPPADDAERRGLLEQYRLFVETSERVVARRQTANTFFLSINSLLLAAVGILLREASGGAVAALGAGLGAAGIVACVAWRHMVTSFRQLNAAKFEIIHLLEEHLPAAMFKAEWDALGSGKEKSRYRPFTGTEAWMPRVFMGLHALVAVGGLVLAVADR